jgi:nitrate reductase NapE component
MLTQRSIWKVVVFSIITFGIYMVWWTYVTTVALQEHGGNKTIPPILTTLLMFFASSAGGALLGFDADTNINEIKKLRGMQTTDNKVLWIVLGVIFPVVTVALVQNEINGLV